MKYKAIISKFHQTEFFQPSHRKALRPHMKLTKSTIFSPSVLTKIAELVRIHLIVLVLSALAGCGGNSSVNEDPAAKSTNPNVDVNDDQATTEPSPEQESSSENNSNDSDDSAIDRIVYYISPAGNDLNDGLSTEQPWKSFEHAFDDATGMSSGDELILLSGTYSIANTTGILRGVDGNGVNLLYSGAIPSGLSREQPTIIRAMETGTVKVEGADGVSPLSIGRTFRKDRFIKIKGITFIGGGALYNTEYVVIKDCGFNGSFGIGTNDHSQGNSFNLIEDVWVWAENRRVVASNYRADFNVWRRLTVRSEGCDLAGCESYPKTDPSVGFTVYDSHDVSVQNVIVIDRQIRADSAYGDFATAQHSSEPEYFLGRNEWLGSMSVNSEDEAMTFEADNVVTSGDSIWTISNFVAVGNSSGGINLGNQPYNYVAAGRPGSIIENATIILTDARDDASAFRVSPSLDNAIISHSITVGATRAGYNVRGASVENSLSYDPDASEGAFDTGNCDNCLELVDSPLNDGSILYPQRIEPDSAVANAIPGQQVGADIRFRYGLDGTLFGDTDYNTLTDRPLWPWPNEGRIKTEMCIDSAITRGFCAPDNRLDGNGESTLSSYIWEFLNNAMPGNVNRP